VVNAVNRSVDLKWFNYVGFDEAIVRVAAAQVRDVLGLSRDEVVHAEDVVARGEEQIAQVRPEEARGAGYQYSHTFPLQRGMRALAKWKRALANWTRELAS
jgi:hypothetical protein